MVCLSLSFVIVISKAFEIITAQLTTECISTSPKEDQRYAILLAEFLKLFSGNDENKRIFLTANSSSAVDTSNDCFVKVFDVFDTYCVYYYYQLWKVDEFKSLFHRACEANWLQTETIVELVIMKCKEKPYLRHPDRPLESFSWSSLEYN